MPDHDANNGTALAEQPRGTDNVREKLMMVCVPDLSGRLRGKGIPVAGRHERFAKGLGWTPTNVQITCFDSIAESPFGSFGDVVMRPDPDTEVDVDLGDDRPHEHIVLSDIHQGDGAVWPFCVRSAARTALADLEREAGLTLFSTFEHEFMFKSTDDPAFAYSLRGFRRRKAFAELFVGALRQAGLAPDTFLREYGDHQFEVTVDPVAGIRSADQAAILRELAYACAEATGESLTFTPLRALSGIGNGVHIHLSFRDADGRPATYDPAGPAGMTRKAGAFVAGVLKYLTDYVALVAPSAISYHRLVPHRWSAAFNNLGDRDREAAVRICSLSAPDEAGRAKQFNVEFRVTDAAASPHLAIATLVRAGLAGIRENLQAPEPTREDLSLLSPETLAERGIARLPGGLAEALDRLAASETVKSWFPPGFVDVYVAHKRGELATLEGMSEDEIFDAYARAY